jgi:ribosome maturation factor RimP
MGRLDDRAYEIAGEVALGLGVEVEDIELLGLGRGRTLRVTLDKAGGVTVDDCAGFSREFGAALDVEDSIAGSYNLEVSSPGLDRPLKKPRDYEKSLGKLVKVVLNEQIRGQGFLVGRLKDVWEDRVMLSVGEGEEEVLFSNIKRARLEVEI